MISDSLRWRRDVVDWNSWVMRGSSAVLRMESRALYVLAISVLLNYVPSPCCLLKLSKKTMSSSQDSGMETGLSGDMVVGGSVLR